MTLEAGKEMDRRCVMNWLIKIYQNPTVAFNTHSDAQQKEYAHDTLVLLKEQEAIKPEKDEVGLIHCRNCNALLEHHPFYCWNCGQAVKWE